MGIFNKKNTKSDNNSVHINTDSMENFMISNDDYKSKPLTTNLSKNIEYINEYFAENLDFTSNEIILENDQQTLNIKLLCFTGLVDQNLLNNVIMDAINKNYHKSTTKLNTSEEIFNHFRYNILTMIGVTSVDKFEDLFNLILSGNMIVLIEGCDKALIIGARKVKERPVEKPTSQLSIMGSNESFNENYLTNISLVRKRIKNPNFIVKNYILGKESNTNVGVAYIKGIVSDDIINEVKSRIEKIDIPVVLNSTSIENAIKEKPYSLFPKFYYSERPDTVVANLFEGRIAIFIDGSPEVLVVPSVFVQFLHSADDFNQKSLIASFFRTLRFIGFFLGLYAPAIYLSLILHHSELLPVKLLDSIAGQVKTTPLPGFLELLLVMVAFDILRESGARMPSYLGSALSFVGAIIIGQSSVEAGLIAPIIVIIVAIAGVGTQLISNYKLNLTVTVVQYLFVIIAIFTGLYGITLASIILIIHLVSLKSFGADYLSPFAPFSKEGIKDSFIRFPIDQIIKRKRKSEHFPH